jgi:SAM-dependent methyltransferase
MRNAEFNDPRLVMVYDAMCPWSRDDDFFASVVNETPAAGVLDLGCGTGRLALGLAASGHRVTGVDPAAASLAAARAKPGAADVTWLEGTSAVLPAAAFDVAVMTSHVAQFFVAADDWRRTLADLRRALVPGGRLAFDSRDPGARGWERWNPADWRHHLTLPDGSTVTAWIEVTGVRGFDVDSTIVYEFDDGVTLESSTTLRFRPEAELRATLGDAGFSIDHIYGGWNREPIGAPDGELLVIARARLAVVDELQGYVEFLALEQGNDILELVLLLGRDSQLVTLHLGADALRALVPDELGDLPRVVLGDALLEADGDLVLLAGWLGLAGVENLERDRALDQLLLEDLKHGLGSGFAVGPDLHGFLA